MSVVLASTLGLALGADGAGPTGGTPEPVKWLVPLARFADGRVICRAVRTGLGAEMRTIETLLDMHLWDPARDDMLFVVLDSTGAFMGGFTIKAYILGQSPIGPIGPGSLIHAADIQTSFRLLPPRGEALRQAALWVLTELMGLNHLWNPKQVSATVQAKLLVPNIYVGPEIMQPRKVDLHMINERQPQLLSGGVSWDQFLDDVDGQLQMWVNRGFAVVATERMDEDGEDLQERWATWRLYLGGPNIVNLELMAYPDELEWKIGDTDNQPLVEAPSPSPFQAVIDAELVVRHDELEAWSDAHVPEWDWVSPQVADLMEPFALLGELTPFLWPVDKLIAWAEPLGLLQ